MSDAIHCAIRIRPRLDDGFQQSLWTVRKNVISSCTETFSFETVYDELTHTSQIFNNGIIELVDGTLTGVNGSIMAYGQSGSGKTHTLTGNRFEDGITQFSLKRIFKKIEESNKTFALRMSICEVYNEKVFDLCGTGEDLPIREDSKSIPRVEGLVEVPLTDLASATHIVDASIRRRSTGETARNERSSRSHVLFIIWMESRSNGSNRSLSSSLCIVDLAGSENAMLSVGSRLNEGKFINKSLLALCKVITQLSEKQSHVNYRDSKLTRLLKPSLSGNSRIVIIATVDGGVATETSSTLKFAKCAVKVSVAPKVNENVEEEGILACYMKQIDDLKEQLKDKEEADNKEEEKKKKLDELMRLILVGGEHKKEPFQKAKNRRMTWAPGRGATTTLFSPLPFHPSNKKSKEEEKIEEEEEASNNDNEDKRDSLESIGVYIDACDRVKHNCGQTSEFVTKEIGENKDEYEDESNRMKNERDKMEYEKMELERAKIALNEKTKTFQEESDRMKLIAEDETARMNEKWRGLDQKMAEIAKREEQLNMREKEMMDKSKEKNDKEKNEDDSLESREILRRMNGELKMKMAELEGRVKEKSNDEQEFEENLRREIVENVQSKVENKLKEMMDEICQLRKENRMKEERIECLVKAEHSMLVGPSDEVDKMYRLEEENEDIKQKLKEKEEQVKERDVYINIARKGEESMKKRVTEFEKKLSDQQQTIIERTSQVNRYRDEINGIKTKKDQEVDQLRDKHKFEVKKMLEEMNGLKMKMEFMEKEISKKEDDRKCSERNGEDLRIKCIRLNNELSIEKERQKKDGVNFHKQLEIAAAEAESKFERLEKEFEEYRATMKRKEEKGYEEARANVKYWQDRARKAEAEMESKKGSKKTALLARIDNNI